MKTSLRGAIEIASHEGIVLSPYRDSVGVWTIFVGHTATAGAPDPAALPRGKARPIEEAFEVFRRDLARFEKRVNDAVHVSLAQHEFDALVSFDFNTGGIHRAELTKRLNAGDRAGAADGFMGWKKPPEIIPRRKKEQALFRDGAYAADGHATVYRASSSGKVMWDSGKRVNVADLFARPEVDPGEPTRKAPPQDTAPQPVPVAPPEPKAISTAVWLWPLVLLALLGLGLLVLLATT